jgi:hypothetical protein
MRIWMRSHSWRDLARVALVGGLGLTLVTLVVILVVTRVGSSVPTDVPPPTADALAITITRHDGLVPGGAEQVIFSRQLTDAQTIAKIQRGLATITFVKPDEVFNCPAGAPVYNHYDLRFTEHGTQVEEATSDATDCQFWIILTQRGRAVRIDTSDGIYALLNRETGAPLPIQRFPGTPSA